LASAATPGWVSLTSAAAAARVTKGFWVFMARSWAVDSGIGT
jgi:hypothetical protein